MPERRADVRSHDKDAGVTVAFWSRQALVFALNGRNLFSVPVDLGYSSARQTSATSLLDYGQPARRVRVMPNDGCITGSRRKSLRKLGTAEPSFSTGGVGLDVTRDGGCVCLIEQIPCATRVATIDPCASPVRAMADAGSPSASRVCLRSVAS